jgi:Ca-activated chloride channel homolog
MSGHPRAARVASVAMLVAALAASKGLAAAKTPAPLAVTIVEPALGTPLIGVVDIRLHVTGSGAAGARVEIYLDGALALTLLKPPWQAQLDVGPEPKAHSLEAVVTSSHGQSASTTLNAEALRTDLEIAVNLQPVFVKVRRGGDSRGQAVHGLARQDFTVYDNGDEQQIVTFEYGSIPFNAVLLLDASTSMAGERLRAAVAGADSFARHQQPLDQTKLLVFADRLLHETTFTNLPGILTLGLGGIEARGGSAVLDAIALGCARLERERGRRVLILLSDGLDVDSVLDLGRVRRLARRAQAVVYWLRTGSAVADGAAYVTLWRKPEANARALAGISELVEESGGRTFEVSNPDDIGDRLAAVLSELREQYVLGYYPSTLSGTGTWHNLRVEVRGGGDVRAQRGYSEP